MIIEVLSQKYKVGCGRGMSLVERSNLLWKLNTIIEWNLCKFPKKVEKTTNDAGEEVETEVELRDYLGENPELKPGDVFLFRGQVIAVESKDELVLIVSETGIKALDRIVEDYIDPEVDLFFKTSGIYNLSVEAISKDSISDLNLASYSPSYSIYEIWKDKYIKGRGFVDDFMLKVSIESEDLVTPVTIYLGKWKVFYEPGGIIDDTIIDTITEDAISWIYQNNERIV